MIDHTEVFHSLKKRRAFLITELAEWLRCSLPTCRRRIKEWHVLTSYNHNGRYYTLPDTPKFDPHGLWHYRDISFSKFGNLKKTLVCLVRDASHGLSAAEIGEILKVNPQSFLSHFQKEPALYREKVGGRFIWFSADARIRRQQKQRRSQLERQQRMLMPSDREAVIILVDLLHHPDTTSKRIVRRVKQKGVELSQEIIHDFLAHHDLLKKTTDPNSSIV